MALGGGFGPADGRVQQGDPGADQCWGLRAGCGESGEEGSIRDGLIWRKRRYGCV